MKRKTLKDRFEECYTAVPMPADNAKGFKMEYIYCAPWHLWEIPETSLLRIRWILPVLEAVSVSLDLFAMSRRTPVNSLLPAFLPIALILCCHILEGLGIGKFMAAGEKTTKMNYEEVDLLLTAPPMIRGILGILLAAVGLLLGLRGDLDAAFWMAACYLLSAGTGLYLQREYRRLPHKTLVNNSLQEYDQGIGKGFETLEGFGSGGEV